MVNRCFLKGKIAVARPVKLKNDRTQQGRGFWAISSWPPAPAGSPAGHLVSWPTWSARTVSKTTL